MHESKISDYISFSFLDLSFEFCNSVYDQLTMGLLCCLRHILHNRAKTFCVRRWLRLNITRTSSHYVPDDGLWRSDDELESLKKAQEFLDSLTGEMKKKLEIIEMQYEIMKSNNEPVSIG